MPSTWKKKSEKEWWSQINEDSVRSYGTIACGNIGPLLFIMDGLELSEMCIKNHNGLFQRSLFKSSFTDLYVGKWYNFIVSQKCIGLDDMYSDWSNYLFTEEAIWNVN